MSKSRWVTSTWPRLLISIFGLAVVVGLIRWCGCLTTAEALNVFLVGSLVLVTTVHVVEAAMMRKNSEASTTALLQQAKATSELAEAVKKMMEDRESHKGGQGQS